MRGHAHYIVLSHISKSWHKKHTLGLAGGELTSSKSLSSSSLKSSSVSLQVRNREESQQRDQQMLLQATARLCNQLPADISCHIMAVVSFSPRHRLTCGQITREKAHRVRGASGNSLKWHQLVVGHNASASKADLMLSTSSSSSSDDSTTTGFFFAAGRFGRSLAAAGPAPVSALLATARSPMPPAQAKDTLLSEQQQG